MEIKEALLKEQWQAMLEGKDVEKEQIRLKDCTHFQEKNPDLDEDTVLIEINTSRSTHKRGHLDWQSILIHPIRVGDEYNMTEGAFHIRPDSEDYIWCESGEGLLMLMDRNGRCWCEELEEGSLHHIDEDLAIRLINISDEPLLVAHCYPSEAGLDTEILQTLPFPCHIYDDNGEMCIRVDVPETLETENEDYTFDDAARPHREENTK